MVAFIGFSLRSPPLKTVVRQRIDDPTTSQKKPAAMITRYAMFEGHVETAHIEAFRAAVLTEILPKWRAFPGASAVRVCFENDRDAGAPELPLILAISYADSAAMEVALASPARSAAKAATEDVMARFFKGHIHHHITKAHDHPS
jgi:quinol monooxygenase YgiN